MFCSRMIGCGALAMLAWAVAAPLLAAEFPLLALAARQFFSAMCHQETERSLRLAGTAMPICARCFGLVVGVAAGAFAGTRLASRVFIAALAANMLDVALEASGLYGSIAGVRVALGFAAGVAATALLVPRDQQAYAR